MSIDASTNAYKTPLHISFLLGILAIFGFVHFSFGWLGNDPTAMFPDVVREGEGLIHLLGANGSRQLAISVLLLIGAFTRQIAFVRSGLIVRMVCEIFDIILYGFIIGQFASAMVATGLFTWEIVAMVQLYQRQAQNS